MSDYVTDCDNEWQYPKCIVGYILILYTVTRLHRPFVQVGLNFLAGRI